METEPLLRVNGPTEPTTVTPSLAKAFKETGSPLAGAGATAIVAVKFVPEGEPPLGAERVVTVAVRMAEVHFVNKFPTLMEPNPVAKSYFVVDWKAGTALSTAGQTWLGGVFELFVVLQMTTPYPTEVTLVLLQLGLPGSHATALLPLVTSLKTQEAAGVCPREEAQPPEL